MASHTLLLIVAVTAVFGDPSCPGNCDRDSQGRCKPQVRCFVAPCQTPYTQSERACIAKVPGGVRCLNDYCGGCNRKFVSISTGAPVCQGTLPEGAACSTSTFDNLEPIPCDDGLFCNITNPGDPDAGIPNSGVCTEDVDPPCPGDCERDDNGNCIPVAKCFVDPCKFVPSICRGQANLTCEANYCGGCFATWYDANGNEACQYINEGSACTLSGSRGVPAIPCDSGLFCNITYAGNPSRDIPNKGTCSQCAPYTLCSADSDCSVLGNFFKCVGVRANGCTPSRCTVGPDCKFTSCTKDCRKNVGRCEQVLTPSANFLVQN